MGVSIPYHVVDILDIVNEAYTYANVETLDNWFTMELGAIAQWLKRYIDDRKVTALYPAKAAATRYVIIELISP